MQAYNKNNRQKDSINSSGMQLKHYAVLLTAIWTILTAFLIFTEYRGFRSDIVENMTNQKQRISGKEHLVRVSLGYGGIWLVGLFIIRIGYVRLSRHDAARAKMEQALHEANAALERNVRERTVELESAVMMLQGEIEDRSRAEARFRTLVEQAPTAIRIAREGKTIYANPKFAEMFGYRSIDEIRNTSLTEQYATEVRSKIAERARRREEGLEEPSAYETLGMRKDGSIFPLHVAVTKVMLDDGAATLSFFTDITDLRKAEEALRKLNAELEQRVAERTLELEQANRKLEQLAIQDGLTGLANRRHLDNMLERELARGLRTSDMLTFLMCDVDFFKRFNDFYGHAAGDVCLQKIGAVLRSVFRRASDLPARYGGEEFGVIIPHTPPEHAAMLAEMLLRKVQEEAIPHERSEIAAVVTISIGLVSAPITNDKDSKWYIARADEALYKSKKSGRNRVTHAVFGKEN